MSISEKTAKFSLPDRSKFHLPERPKFNFPDKSRFHLPERPKFNIKKPNIRLPEAFARVKRPSLREQQQHSTESTVGSKRNIFDFATYPRIFDKKSKKHSEYATSSPKDSRTQSAESATFPRTRKKKSFGARWTQRFSTYNPDQDRPEEEAAASDGSPPWHQSSIEEPPRLSARTEEEISAAARAIPWEDARKREQYDEEEIQYMDYEQESSEMSDRHPAPPKRMHKMSGRQESYEQEEAMDPRLYDDREIKRVHGDEDEEDEDATTPADWRADQEMLEEKFRPIPRSRSLDEDMPRALERKQYGEAFMAVDPRRFGSHKMTPEEEKEDEEGELEEYEEEHEPSSMQSDREQQASSGSSCDRRRHGVIEEVDSDEFFVRASGISQDDINLNNYLTDEIREALRSKIDEFPPTPPPQRPMRTLKKRKEDLTEQSIEEIPPARPKRERSAAARRSREASIVDDVFRERTRSDSRSDSRHRVVYQTEGNQSEPSQEPLDDIVVVKPARRKSRSSLRSQSQPPMETSILFPSLPAIDSSALLSATPPVVPVRRKRSHRETMMDRRNGDVTPICNGHRDDEWEIEIATSKKPVIPTRKSRSRQSLVERDVVSTSRDNIINLDVRHRRAESSPEPEVVPVPPKRRSRSRTTSVAADEDRTSHGAESLPEAGYIEEDIPREDENGSRDFSGYAIVEKREKPPRPPPPRRKRNKFATTPRPTPPKRPQRAYSTLGPARTRDTSAASETIIGMTLTPSESAPYIEIDAEDMEHRDFPSGMFKRDKIQGRPLPAPPRPPRMKKEHAIERPRTPFEYSETMEMTAATQTDPLPDDMVIEEITQAKLIVTPSMSGSQVMVSMERIPSPSRTSTPPVPPLPISQFIRKEEEEEEEEEEERQEEDIRMTYDDTVSLRTPSPMRERDLEDKHRSAPHLEERVAKESQSRPQIKPSGLLSDEPLRISTLEVGDLKVDRLSVSQIEAHKIMASEVDAMIITASELRGGSSVEESFSPAIIRELMAIRSHLETVVQERHRESEESASRKITDIPTTDDSQVREQESVLQEDSREVAESDEAIVIEPVLAEDEETETNEDQKIPNIP